MLYEVITALTQQVDMAAQQLCQGIGGQFLLGPGTVGQAGADAQADAPRITSYNVCYTKLLRHPDNLLSAYGGHLHLVPTEDGALALGDTCCGDHDLP